MELSGNTISINKIKPNPENPRVIHDDKFRKLCESLRAFPQMMEKRPIVVDENWVILGGNMRYRALKENGMKQIPVEWVSIAEGWTDDQKKEFVIKDNAGFGEWDWDALANWDVPLADWGVDVPEWDGNGGGGETEAKEDDFNEENETIVCRCKKGDIWQCGNHRVMCGDSTDAANFALLMNGERADIAFTSPPYNMMQSGINDVLKNGGLNVTYDVRNGTYNEFDDCMTNEEYTNLLNASLSNAIKYSDDVMFNIGILSGSKVGIINMLKEHQRCFCDIIVWNKSNSIPIGFQPGLISHRCELVFCFNKNGSRAFSHPQWKDCKFDGEMMINRVDTKNCSNNEFAKIHHATFPVELPFWFIERFAKDSVLDLFGGTGTTMIAAEQLNRKCYMMELDPHYCDVILARWEKLTGRTAEKVN